MEIGVIPSLYEKLLCTKSTDLQQPQLLVQRPEIKISLNRIYIKARKVGSSRGLAGTGLQLC